ncbi:transmembrane protein 130 [Peromyscus californicus insignis]|uniref:transmembrane protein 130 n=1 Tax=Peromyscus californicus insignis TaxID=564181 RepID=UPI0022A68B80|nr:transmembrane protein 130 [Peromyscus californicus insignis]
MAKATDVWSDLGLVFLLACLLPLGPAKVAAGLYNLSLATDGPATVGTEVTISANLTVKDNGSLSLPADTHLYRFHWVHTPLILTAKTEKNLTSTIHVVGRVAGDFSVSVWVTAVDCWMCKPLARSALVLPIKESLVGKLVITQNTSVSWPNAYLTNKSLRFSFFLHDPSDFFKLASFFYRWDFGDGTLLITDTPVAYYNYSSVGTFTVKVRVVAEWEQTKPDAAKGTVQRSGDFSASLKLREALQGIQVLGPTLLQTFQKFTMTMNFLGSPPLEVCWGLKPQCLPLEDRECHSVLVTSTSFNLSHVFQDPGDYCFIFRAENVINKAHQFHRIQVWPSSLQPIVFAFPCATLITVLLVFIMYMTVRSAAQQKDPTESPEMTGLKCCCQLCCGSLFLESPSEYLEIVRENHGLLPPLYKPMKTYNV